MAHPIRPLDALVTLHITAHALPASLCFADSSSRLHGLQSLQRLVRERQVEIHAYALMDNHLHLLMTGLEAGQIAAGMRWFLSGHAHRVNKALGRRGPLWDDRYRSVLVAEESHLLNSCLYIDSNPWRARVVRHPEESDWTSYRELSRGGEVGFLTPHPVLLGLGTGTADWRSGYRNMMEEYLRRASRSCSLGRIPGGPDPLAGLRLSIWHE